MLRFITALLSSVICTVASSRSKFGRFDQPLSSDSSRSSFWSPSYIWHPRRRVEQWCRLVCHLIAHTLGEHNLRANYTAHWMYPTDWPTHCDGQQNCWPLCCLHSSVCQLDAFRFDALRPFLPSFFLVSGGGNHQNCEPLTSTDVHWL